jgi:hypothetical protein
VTAEIGAEPARCDRDSASSPRHSENIPQNDYNPIRCKPQRNCFDRISAERLTDVRQPEGGGRDFASPIVFDPEVQTRKSVQARREALFEPELEGRRQARKAAGSAASDVGTQK